MSYTCKNRNRDVWKKYKIKVISGPRTWLFLLRKSDPRWLSGELQKQESHYEERDVLKEKEIEVKGISGHIKSLITTFL